MFAGALGYLSRDSSPDGLRYLLAGQPPPLKRSADGTVTTLPLPAHRLPLGAFRDVPYDTMEMYLKRGDLIFFYTDGFSEAMDTAMDPFGEDRLMDSLASHAAKPLDQIAQGILSDIRGHVSGAEQYDDMTFLFLKVE